jgi:hypothetical protein
MYESSEQILNMIGMECYTESCGMNLSVDHISLM